MADRRHSRVPISLEVAWRTAGSFLVSYSMNLSKGGIFIETSTPLEVGAEVSLKFDVPEAGTLEVDGQVAWVRTGSADGLPDGMGVQFAELEDRFGSVVDDMVRTFAGLTVLVVAASPDRLALLGRYVRSIIACEILEATSSAVAEVALDQHPDLVVADLDVNPELGLRTIRMARAQAAPSDPAGVRRATTPIILLAGHVQVRTQGKAAGADEALATPPSYHELQAAVIRTLSRPIVR